MSSSLYKPGDKVTIVYFQPELHYRGGVNDEMRNISGTIQEIEDMEYRRNMFNYDMPEFNNEKIYYN